MPAAASEAVTAAYQRQQLAIVVDVTRQVTGLWREVDPRAVDRSWPIVSRGIANVIDKGYASSTAQAVHYLREHAGAAGIDLAGTVLAAQRLNPEQLATALRVTGPVAVKQAAGQGMSPEQASRVALVRLSGSAGRLSLLGGRQTIAQTVEGSDKIVGWRRVIGAGACYFCAMLASRGAVYKDEQRATFRGTSGHKYHDHCHCLPEPLYQHEQEPAEVEALRRQYQDAQLHTDGGADPINAFRRGYDPTTGAALVERRAVEGAAAVEAAATAAKAAELTNLSDDDLAGRLAHTEDEAEIDRILAELERRDAVAAAEREAEAKRAAAKERRDAKRAAELAAKDAEYDRLLEAGEDPEEAYAKAFGVSVEKQRAQAAIVALREQGYAGVNFERLSAAAYRDEVNRLYFVAEDATRGSVVNNAGRAAGIDPMTLFTGGEARARKYASDELLAWWDDYGRLSLADFRASLLGGKMRERTGAETWLQ